MASIRERVRLRPPVTLYPTSLNYILWPNHRVFFHHPAYEARNDLLFSLYAWDHPDGGIYHAVAHNACAIIADNRIDGYLSNTRNGAPIDAAMDDILPLGHYYFHVPGLLLVEIEHQKISNA